MRKHLCCWLTALLGLLPAVVYGQLQDQRNNLSVGVNGGIHLNTVSFEPRIKQGTSIAPTLGVTARYICEKYFKMICGVQAEINYSVHGWKENIEDGTGDTYRRKMNYIEIPVLAHLAFGSDRNRGARFVLNLGPQIGFLLSESEEKGGPWTDLSLRAGGVTQQYGYMADKKFAYGITAGGGAEIRTGIGHFVIEARYYLGLSDFYNNTKKDFFSRSGQSAITAKLTYLFDLIK